ncbi:MAG TPA: M43 family zinc metalloprotease [Brumimicrobium sp.]|nr:M43 family zinc metalloprotease [Brumimicrobium sp.]
MKYLLSIVVFFAFFAHSQEPATGCGTHTKTAELWSENPELETAFYAQQEQALNGYYLKAENTYIIPIVFHVVHEYGPENISDEQIYRSVEILNEDYRKLNPSIADVVPEFQGIAADANIEFRLATRDPFGNCTNGITRHFSSETKFADDYSKFEQWPRNRYLNIWTVIQLTDPGVGGYSFYPSNVEGAARFRDGVILKHTAVGDIGTSSTNNAFTLTHEIGHYLGLPHTWGPTNDPGLPGNCATDDGIADTPNTIGSTLNCDLTMTTCDTILDNVQNYMDYSYCSNMFTEGQAAYMRNILEQNVSGRSNLWTAENLALSIPAGGVCDPVADFHANYLTACVGDLVQFKNHSWRLAGNNAVYTWTFEDGSVVTSNDVNPTISFTEAGWKTVSLTVEEDGLTNTKTVNKFIYITPNWPVYSGNVQFDFNDGLGTWTVHNPQSNVNQWDYKSNAGVMGSGAMFLNNTNPATDIVPWTPEYFFNERRGGVTHSFISQPIDLSYMSDISVSFDYACATDGTTVEEMKEKLVVYVSTNCGRTWQPRNTILGNEPNPNKKSLINNGSAWDSFLPSETTLWDNSSFTLNNSFATTVLIKFEYTASDKSNNIAIDNININGVLSTDGHVKESPISVYPNPSNNELGWDINYDPSEWAGAEVVLTDMSGRTVAQSQLPKGQSLWNVNPGSSASQGVYILKISHNNKVIQNKLILQ